MTPTPPPQLKLGRKSAILVTALCALPLNLTCSAVGAPGRRMAAAISAIVIGGTVLSYEDKWANAWFWAAITILVALHGALVLMLPWSGENGSGPALAGQAIIDGALCFAFVGLTEKLVNWNIQWGKRE